MDIGVDLGTANVLIYVRGKGVVLREPSVVAVDQSTGKVLEIGEGARRMLGRTPGNIVAIRPLREGVIADFDITEIMLRYFITKVCGRHMLFRPRVMIGVPSGITSVEKRAVIQAAQHAGARTTWILEQPLAAALGAGLDISEPSGSMVVDIGGGTTDIAVLSLGDVVLSQSIRVAGDKFDEAIIRYIRRQHNVAIGERTAEELKIEVGSALPEARNATMEVRGRDLVSGLPTTITVTSEDVARALDEPVQNILAAIRSVLERTPPELAGDIMDKGIVLTGGGAMLHGLDRFLTRETSVPFHLAEDAISCVALGTGKALENFSLVQSHILATTGSRSNGQM